MCYYTIGGKNTHIVSSSWWWAQNCPKHVEYIISAINHSVVSSWFFFSMHMEVNYRQKTSICSWNREVFVSKDSCNCLNLWHSKQYCWGHIFIFYLVHRFMTNRSCVCISHLHNVDALQWADTLSQDAYQSSIEKFHKIRKCCWQTLAIPAHLHVTKHCTCLKNFYQFWFVKSCS